MNEIIQVQANTADAIKDQLEKLLIDGDITFDQIIIVSPEAGEGIRFYTEFSYGYEGLNPSPANLGIAYYECISTGAYYKVSYLLKEIGPKRYKGIQEIVAVDLIE